MVPAQDGAICRLKLALGRLSAEQAHAVADAAATYANGVIEITNRSNLQIRGVRTANENALIDALLAAGLGPLTEAGDDVRNVMVSPKAGLDPHQIINVRPLAEHVLTLLQTKPRYHVLSPKFSLLIDGGESIAMVSHPHDVWLSALPETGAQKPHFAFGLSGTIPTGADHLPALGAIDAEHASELITAVLDLFLEQSARQPGISRMRHLLAQTDSAMFLSDLEKRIDFPIRPNNAVARWWRAKPASTGHIGISPQRSADRISVGAMPALGRLDTDMLHAMANLAAHANGGELRMTPWRSVILPDIATDRASSIVRQLGQLGLVTEAGNPLARMIACSGSSGCASAFTDTQADGKRLAALLHGKARNLEAHLSGCAKSCAAAHVPDASLIAVAPDQYDLFLRAKDGPTRFGRLLAAGVTIVEAARLLNALPDRSLWDSEIH